MRKKLMTLILGLSFMLSGSSFAKGEISNCTSLAKKELNLFVDKAHIGSNKNMLKSLTNSSYNQVDCWDVIWALIEVFSSRDFFCSMDAGSDSCRELTVFAAQFEAQVCASECGSCGPGQSIRFGEVSPSAKSTP